MADGTATTADGTASMEAALADSQRGDADATATDGGYDATIQYADAARLPEGGGDAAASSSGEGGAVVAGPWDNWPSCAPDMAVVDPNGPVTPCPGNAANPACSEEPSDSGSCATYDWTGLGDAGQSCNQCLRANVCGLGLSVVDTPWNILEGVFPPCSDLREAGVAAEGPGLGQPLFDLCAALYECVLRTNCFYSQPVPTPSNCYCGGAQGSACVAAGAADGGCKTEIEAAEQIAPGTSASDVLSHLTDIKTPAVYAGSQVMGLFNCALTAPCLMCFPDGG